MRLPGFGRDEKKFGEGTVEAGLGRASSGRPRQYRDGSNGRFVSGDIRPVNGGQPKTAKPHKRCCTCADCKHDGGKDGWTIPGL